MAAEFDPYHKWLAIPPDESASGGPNLYRLLGVTPFESDPDVIDTAANARMIHLRSLQSGPQAELTQKLLNEIAAARICLLKPERKASYDATLREQLARKIAARTPPPLPASRTISAPPVVPGDGAADPASNLLEFISAASQPGGAGVGSRSSAAGNGRVPYAKKSSRAQRLLILAPLLGIGVVVAAIVYRNSKDATDPKPVSSAGLGDVAPAKRPNAAVAAAPSPAPPVVAKPAVHKTEVVQPVAVQPEAAAPVIAKPELTFPAPQNPAPAVVNTTVVATPPATGSAQAPVRANEPKPYSKPALIGTPGNLRLQYRCAEPKSETNQVRCQIQIANDGDTPIPLADLKVRYWCARGIDRPWTFWCDYAAINKDNITGRFVAVDRPTDHAAAYLELTFSAGAGEIKPGASSGEIQCRFAVDDWSNLEQAKDFSYDPAATELVSNPRIAIYQRGKLVWGQEPPVGRRRASK